MCPTRAKSTQPHKPIDSTVGTEGVSEGIERVGDATRNWAWRIHPGGDPGLRKHKPQVYCGLAPPSYLRPTQRATYPPLQATSVYALCGAPTAPSIRPPRPHLRESTVYSDEAWASIVRVITCVRACVRAFGGGGGVHGPTSFYGGIPYDNMCVHVQTCSSLDCKSLRPLALTIPRKGYTGSTCQSECC